MRDVLRLIALALVIFGVTFLAFLFSNRETSTHLTERLGLSDRPLAVSSERLTGSDRVLRLPASRVAAWTGLIGFPSQSQIVFDIPQQIRPLRAQLQLDLESELIEHGDGLVRLYVNDNLVDAILLEPGRAEHRLTYDLSQMDIATGEIVVRLEGNGTTNYGQVCPTNVTNLGAVVHVLPSTALTLELANPLSDPAVHAALLSPPLQIEAAGNVIPAAWTPQWLERQGVSAELTGAAVADGIDVMPTDGQPTLTLGAGKLSVAGPAGVAELARLRGGSLPASYGQSWPLPVSALTTDTLTHTFRASTRWQLNYKLADLPEGKAPDALDLRLKTSELRGDNYWSLRVTLNGALVHSSNHPGTGNDLALRIPLPVPNQLLTNRMVVTLIDNTPNQGICRAGPEQAAQVLPATTLTTGTNPEADAQILVQQLAAADRVGVKAAEGSNLETAVQLAGMLDLILPLDTPVDLTGSEGPVLIQAAAGAGVSELLQAAAGQGKEVYVVWGGGKENGIAPEPAVQRIEPGAQPPQIPAGSTGLVVTW